MGKALPWLDPLKRDGYGKNSRPRMTDMGTELAEGGREWIYPFREGTGSLRERNA